MRWGLGALLEYKTLSQAGIVQALPEGLSRAAPVPGQGQSLGSSRAGAELSSPSPYSQPGPGVAVGQAPFEQGCHVPDGDVDGTVLLELHLAPLDGQIIDLDAGNSRSRVCPQPRAVCCGLFLRNGISEGPVPVPGSGAFANPRVRYKGSDSDACAQPWCAAIFGYKVLELFKQETWNNATLFHCSALCSRGHGRKSVLWVHH